MIFDIVIVGAGPAGLALACGFANTKLKIAIIDKLSKKILTNPAIDGREIALTHHSVNILKKIDVWRHIPNQLISTIKEAKILDDSSKYSLDFKHQDKNEGSLGYLIPNNIIRKYLYKKLKNISNVTLINKTECLSIDNSNNEYSLLLLSNKRKIKCSLVVAADSRFSKMRSKVGISAFIHNFDKNMIVCRMKHERPHNNIAYEFFRYKQTQASLPYIKRQSSIVTTSSKETSSYLKRISEKEFNKEIQKNLIIFLGK